jgi:hypothetical protein
MARSVYFSQRYRPEQNLLEDLLIESMKIMGHDVYYIPRKIVKHDFILNEDVISSFDASFLIEMFVESVDGFEGDGDLMTKFGLETRDQVTLVCSSRRWNSLIGRHGYTNDSVRPREGDLIYLPFTGGLFEIKFVEDKIPFFQLGGSGDKKSTIPTFKLTCELFEYGGQEIDTGIDEIDSIQIGHTQGSRALLDFDGGEVHNLGETLTIELPSGVTGSAELLQYEHTAGGIIATFGTLTFNDGEFHVLTTETELTGQTSGTTSTVTSVVDLDDGDAALFINDDLTQNCSFELAGNDYIDFSESNPFGDPS